MLKHIALYSWTYTTCTFETTLAYAAELSGPSYPEHLNPSVGVIPCSAYTSALPTVACTL